MHDDQCGDEKTKQRMQKSCKASSAAHAPRTASTVRISSSLAKSDAAIVDALTAF
jgi:hypothetical protein